MWAGARRRPHWSAPARTVDFFDAKGVVEEIAAALGVAVELRAGGQRISSSPAAPLKYVSRAADGKAALGLGIVGKLSPAVADARGFPAAEDLYVLELDLDALAIAAA